MKTMKWCTCLVALLLVTLLGSFPVFAQTDNLLPDRGWLRGGIIWSPDSTQLAVGTSLGVWIYSVEPWEDVLFRDDQHYITSLAWSPGGHQIASASGEAIDLWDATTGKTLMILEGHTSTVSVVSWSPDGTMLASGSWDNTVRLWDANSGETQHVLDIQKGDSGLITPWSVSWSPSGGQIAVNGITIWDVTTGEMLQEWTDVDEAETAKWQPNGDRIAAETFEGQIEIRDASNGDLLLSLGGHPQLVSSLVWSPDGTLLASTGGNYAEGSRQIKVWDTATGELVVDLEKGITIGDATFYEYALAWSPDGRWLASTSDDGMLHLWDTDTWELVRIDNRYYSLLISEDNPVPTLIATVTPVSE